MLDAPTQSYVDARDSMRSVVRNFYIRYGTQTNGELSMEELTAEANAAFAWFYNKCRSRPRGDWTKWIVRVVSFRLHDMRRRRARRHRILQHHNLGDMESVVVDVPAPSFDVGSFARDLTTDAKIVLQLTLEIAPRDEERYGRPSTSRIRKAVRRQLCWLGWAADRIVESFAEIKEAL